MHERFGDELTNLGYNDHGDVSDEVAIRTPRPDLDAAFGMDEDGNMVPVSESEGPGPSRTDFRYTYQCEAQGNWTKKTGVGTPRTG